MTPTFGHTPHIDKQTIELAIVSLILNIVPKTNLSPLDPKMAQFFMSMLYKAFKTF
jgi:hypothetical protein